MWDGHRVSTLTAMTNVRRIATGELLADGKPEAAMLEIAELAFIPKADGFPEREIFKRIGRVHESAPCFDAYVGLRLFDYLRDYLHVHHPEYWPLADGKVFACAITLAELWAELFAGRMTSSSWPPPAMLTEPWDILGYAGITRAGNTKPEDWPTFAGNLSDLNLLIAGASRPRCSGEAARQYRRMKARAIPGDVLHGYSTGAKSFGAMMGSAGIALVREGRSIDYVETIMN
jgi:hypothetical protein